MWIVERQLTLQKFLLSEKILFFFSHRYYIITSALGVCSDITLSIHPCTTPNVHVRYNHISILWKKSFFLARFKWFSLTVEWKFETFSYWDSMSAQCRDSVMRCLFQATRGRERLWQSTAPASWRMWTRR